MREWMRICFFSILLTSDLSLPTHTPDPGEQQYMVDDLDMVDAQHDWAIFMQEFNHDGQYWLGRTSDGGYTWVNVPPPTYKTIRSGQLRVSALDSERAWTYASGSPSFLRYEFPAVIWRTVDGGRSWQTLPAIPDCHFWRSGCTPSRIQFVDHQHGSLEITIFVRNNSGDQYYRTIDAETWIR